MADSDGESNPRALDKAPGGALQPEVASAAAEVDSPHLHLIRTVILIGLPFFSFYAMINAQARLRACPCCWMMIGKQSNKPDLVEVLL